MKYFSFGDYRLDTLKNEIRFRDKALDLEPQVYGLLELFITRHGDIVSRDDIIAEVWNGRIVENSTIDNRIRAARSAIGRCEGIAKQHNPSRNLGEAQIFGSFSGGFIGWIVRRLYVFAIYKIRQ